MSNRKDISEKKFKSYKRNHTGGNFKEKEICKIKKEKETVKRLRDKTAKKLKFIDFSNISDDDIDEVIQLENEIKKTSSNIKTHKERFKSLSDNEDFN